jgi:UDP-N-acetyl-2-amino-2-deoxyglucuronate dehydrogenase
MSYRFAIAGCGNIGLRHALNSKRVGELVAVCDIIKEKADLLAIGTGAKPIYDFASLLQEKPDVLCICTPNYLHAAQSIAALEAGIHVLCEKPMTISSADGEKMIAAAAASKRELFIVKQNRFNPPVQLLHGLLHKKELGKIHSFQVNCFWNRPPAYYQQSDWKGKAGKDGGILFTQFSHFIDLIYWLFGEAESVKGFAGNFLLKEVLDKEDTGTVVLKMKNGIIGTLHYTVTAHEQNMEGSITVFGEKGTIKIGGQYLNELDYFSVAGKDKPVFSNAGSANDYGFYKGSMSNHHLLYDELIKALNAEAHQLPSPGDALQTVRMIEQIQLAINP